MSQHILVSVAYIQEKKEIICYFQNECEKIAKRFSFTPYIKLNKQISKEKIEELLISFRLKHFQLKESDSSILLCSNSIENLKKISNLLAKVTNQKHIVLEPERAFLIEKDWSYYEAFLLEKGDSEIKKIDEKLDFSFHLIPNLLFEEALCINKSHTLSLIKQSAFSQILKIPLEKIPISEKEIVELFLENVYFENSQPVLWQNKNAFYSAKQFPPFGEFKKISEIDFSGVWAQLLTKLFFNIGEETINCSCCKPVKLEDSNLLPSTLIRVFPNEDLYYSSSSPTFAFNYHKLSDFKSERKQKRYEFCLKEYPVGPLKYNQEIMLPIEDVKILLDEKKVSLAKNHSLNWFCKNKESFISKEIIKLNLKIFKKKKLLGQEMISNKISFKEYFSKELINALNFLLISLPVHLSDPISKFFSIELAEAINAIQESTITKFKEFSEKSGYRVLYSDKKRVFVKGYSSLALAKHFSIKTKLPQPIVASFSNSTKLTIQA